MALLPGEAGPYVFGSQVPSEAAGRTLLEYLVSRFTYRDGESWKERILAGDVSVEGAAAPDSALVLTGGEAMACVQRDFVEQEIPTDWRISAMGEDWMAVSKPSGMPVHSTPRIYRQTLVWQVRRLWGEGWTPAHRLDRDTSGLLILTDDGALNHRITSPRTHLPKVYEARLAGEGVLAAIPDADGLTADLGGADIFHELEMVGAFDVEDGEVREVDDAAVLAHGEVFRV